MLNNLSSKTIILASASPRRSFILSELQITHKVIKYDFNEEVPEKIKPHEYAEYIAIKKSDQILDKHPSHIYITADTTVVSNNTVLGKPSSKEDAINTISSLINNTHEVISGVCISSEDKKITFNERSLVTFEDLTKEEITFYVDQFKPYDKAGSYGIQEWIGMVGISEIKGCYYNIMGLPTQKLYKALKEF